MIRNAPTILVVFRLASAVVLVPALPAIAAAQAAETASPEPAPPETPAAETPQTETTSAEAPSESPLDRRDRERLETLAAAGLERAVLETAAGRLVYWQGGEGPPLVLLHGSGDSAGTWAATARELVDEHRLLIPDLPGHGASEPAEGVLPFATIVAGFEALLDAAQLDSPILAGNSMGAWLAMLQAHKDPARVARVVAINGGAILGEPSEIKLMPVDREEARQAMAGIRDPSSAPIPDEVLDDIVTRAAGGPIRRMMMDLGGMMAYLLDGKLGEITTPVDLLGQSLSIIITNDLVKNLHDWNTGRELQEHTVFVLNRVVIVGLAALSFGLAWWQLVAPNLSVIIFAQLGVYAYFAAAFVPVLFGTFLHDTPRIAVVAASVTALVVHFGLYYTGQHYFPYYVGQTVKNPGISTALGVVAATGVGWILYLLHGKRAAAKAS